MVKTMVLVVGLLASVACQPLTPVAAPTALPLEETIVPTTPPPANATGLANSRPVQLAIADLATRLAVTAAEIEIVEERPVVWPDGSLGCPQPGMMYPQVQVEGIVIRLRAAGADYQYHGGGRREPFLCETPPPLDTLPANGGGSN